MKLSPSQNPGVPREAAWGRGGKIVWVQIPPLLHAHGGYHDVVWGPNNPKHKFYSKSCIFIITTILLTQKGQSSDTIVSNVMKSKNYQNHNDH